MLWSTVNIFSKDGTKRSQYPMRAADTSGLFAFLLPFETL